MSARPNAKIKTLKPSLTDLTSADWLFAVVVCLLTVAIYMFAGALNGGFVNYDDNLLVTDNSHVKTGLSRENIHWAWNNVEHGLYVPITWMSLQLDARMHGTEKAWGFHRTNILLQGANVALLYIFLRKATASRLLASVAVCLFALHPLRVESVVWVTERKDVLAGLFGFLCLIAYVDFARKAGLWRYAVVLVTFALSLLSKPTLVTLPFVLLLLDIWPLGRWRPIAIEPTQLGEARSGAIETPVSLWRLLLEKLPLLVVAIVISAATILGHKNGGALHETGDIDVLPRLASVCVHYIVYLNKTIEFAHLAIFYPDLPVTARAAIPAAAAILVVTFLAIRQIRTRPWLTVGWLWFLGMFLPMIGIISFGNASVADRFTYWPSIGLAIAVAGAIAEVSRFAPRQRPILFGGLVAILIYFGTFTVMQIGYWQNDLVLWNHALDVTHDNWKAEEKYGVALLDVNNAAEAIPHLTEATQLNPDAIDSRINLGQAYLRLGQIDQAQAAYLDALSVGSAPDDLKAKAEDGLGQSWLTGRDLPDAIVHFRRAVQLDPNFDDARNNLGAALAQSHEWEEAIRQFRMVVAHDPDSYMGQLNLGRDLAGTGHFDQAIEHFQAALSLRPSDVKVKKLLDMAIERRDGVK